MSDDFPAPEKCWRCLKLDDLEYAIEQTYEDASKETDGFMIHTITMEARELEEEINYWSHLECTCVKAI